ncbi:hypothetical protein GN244_ATG20280 [Phytophthora infestans]|uniref:SWIM-type domain-containing protein n=1 Tax=Phytophthora infestans TaxID=4787 RepID=A0A833SJT0_PHYIN|nr:hypothetical protein GN244_ATG20280 [Phytophthora infestans]
MDGARCTRYGNTSKWEVTSNSHIYVCDSEVWSCSCLFHSSIKLPCRHLLMIARDGLRLPEFPDSAVIARWNICVSSELFTSFQTACMEYQQHSAQYLDQEVDPQTHPLPKAINPKPSYVEFMKLRRREKAEMVVLSSAEIYRYALAPLEPLLNQLSNMSSKKFYEHLGNWDKILSKSLRHSDSSGCSDGSTGDGVQDFAHENDDRTADPQDADISNFGVNDDDMIGEVDADTNSDYRRGTGAPNNTSSGRRTPDTSLNSADRSESCGRTASVMVNPANNSTLACRATKDHNKIAECEVGSFALSTRRNGDIDVLKLPANKKRNTTRKSMKQIQLVPAPRKAIISWPNISVQLSDLLRCASVTSDFSVVKRILDAYPRAMTDAFLFGREPVCRRELVCPADFEYNFVRGLWNEFRTRKESKPAVINQLRSINNEEHSQRHTELIVSYGELRKKFTRYIFAIRFPWCEN